ncbi:MAG: single-stranded DNA-binding protein [Alphaproteobacteria bacterium]|nr:single-stranded DNA-binding protein [Alphaproteobacteria bacterium]
MAGINKVILLGHLGKDPEIRSMQNNDRVASMSLATSKKWKDKVTGEEKKQTEWHNVVAFGKLASICEQYLNKGDQAYMEGHLSTTKYTGKDGIERYTTKIILENLQILNSFKGDIRAKEPNGNVEEFRPGSSKLNMSHNYDDVPF